MRRVDMLKEFDSPFLKLEKIRRMKLSFPFFQKKKKVVSFEPQIIKCCHSVISIAICPQTGSELFFFHFNVNSLILILKKLNLDLVWYCNVTTYVAPYKKHDFHTFYRISNTLN